MTDDMEMESEIAEFNLDAIEGPEHPGVPSGFACPDCGGAPSELRNGALFPFPCRGGPAWSPPRLPAEQSEALEAALWTALRALEERAALAGRLVERLQKRGNGRSAAFFQRQSDESKHRAAVIRQVLISGATAAVDGRAADDGEQVGN